MLRPDLEEDFEAIYKDSRPDPYGGSVIPIGQCDQMCPISEMWAREQQQRLHKYETLNYDRVQQVDKSLAIKEFKRSVDNTLDSTFYEIRPWSVLKRTLYHLLLEICFQEDDWMFICDFVFDRLRAVRQDLIVQRIEGLRYIELLEGSIRFYIYSMYRLTCTLKDYSKVPHSRPMLTFEGPVKGLNNYELNVVREMKLTISAMRDCLDSLLMQYDENVPNSPNRVLFESVNLIVNLPFLHGYRDSFSKFIKKSKNRNNNDVLSTVSKMYIEHLSGNHLTALKQLVKLKDHPLIVLTYAPALAQLHNTMMRPLIKMYSATGANTSSIEHLCDIICPRWLDSREERISFTRMIALQYGIYDAKLDRCDYNLIKKANGDKFRNNIRFLAPQSMIDNETRIYALQMISGKDWFFFQSLLDKHQVEQILNPKQGPLTEIDPDEWK